MSIKDHWLDASELTEDDTACAILTLASVINEKTLFDGASGANFGHELALALKNVAENSTHSISAEVGGIVEHQSLD